MTHYLPRPWVPAEPFDYATGGRALSEEERQILRKLQDEHDS